MMELLDFNQIRKLCCVCLTETSEMFALESLLIENDENSISVLESLEKVMSWKMKIPKKYPSKICLMCKTLLKSAYQLNVLFFNSQSTLKDIFKDVYSEDIKNSNNQETAPVEIIFGDCKFNLNEVFIVEKEEPGNENFDGFLKNLGASVSAVFVDKNKTKEHSVKEPKEEIITIETLNSKNHYLSSQNVEKTVSSMMTCDLCIYGLCNCTTREALANQLSKCKNCGIKLDPTIEKIICNACKPQKPPYKRKQQLILCDICGHISTDSSKAAYHLKKHSGRTFHCNLCDKKFFHKMTLNTHVKSHANVRNHLCTICGKDFFYSNALTYHMRMHENDRNYLCEFCDKKFYMSATLKRHRRIHTGDRPYLCKFCSKGFRSNGEKRKHEMTHTGERPYKCRFCEKTFISKYNQLVHHLAHKGPHECDYCNKSFMETEFLHRHIKDKHKNVNTSVKTEDLNL